MSALRTDDIVMTIDLTGWERFILKSIIGSEIEDNHLPTTTKGAWLPIEIEKLRRLAEKLK